MAATNKIINNSFKLKGSFPNMLPIVLSNAPAFGLIFFWCGCNILLPNTFPAEDTSLRPTSNLKLSIRVKNE